MANIMELLKKLSSEIAAHNSLAKQQAAGVVEAGLGKLKSGEIRPILDVPSSSVYYDWVPPSHVTQREISKWPARVLSTGLEKYDGATQLRIQDSPFGKYVTPKGGVLQQRFILASSV